MQKYLACGRDVISVNSQSKKPNYRLKLGDQVVLRIPPPQKIELKPADIALDILYEDNDILVLNKQPGVPVHPAPGHEHDTIVNALLSYLGRGDNLSDIGGEMRPGIVHRLDKDTSGVLLIAKNNVSHEYLSKEFALRRIHKMYEAIVKGVIMQQKETIDKPIARSIHNRKKFTTAEHGKEACTFYEVIDSRGETSWVRLEPKTGRTHQLRVHAASIGHPIIGDRLYARSSSSILFIALVAKKLTITHPRTKESMSFQAPYPDHFRQLAASLGYSLP